MSRKAAYAGNLKETPFADIFYFLVTQKETGALFLRREKVFKAVQFIAGRPVHVASPLARESFLRACVARGRMAVMAAVGLCDQAVESGRLPEEVAQEQRVLTPAVIEALKEEVQLVRLMELFTWRQGEFFFDFDGDASGGQRSPIAERPAGELVLQGVREHMDAGRVRAVYQERMDAVPRAVAVPSKEVHGFVLKSSEAKLLGLMDGRPLGQLIEAGTATPKETLKLIYVLDVLGCVRMVEAGRDERTTERPEDFKEITFEVLEYSRQVESEHARILKESFFRAFGIERRFEEEELRRKYYALAPKLRPEDLYPRAAARVRRMADEAFERLSEGYQALLYWKREEAQGRRDATRRAWQEQVRTESDRLRGEREFLAGREFLDQGQTAKAAEYFERACRHVPDEGEYWAYLGYVQSRAPGAAAGREQGAANLRRALAADANSAAAYRFLAEIREEAGDLPGALEAMRRAVRLRPGSAPLRKAYKRLERLAGGASVTNRGEQIERLAVERRMQEFLDAKRDADLYEILDIPQNADTDTVRRAYFRAAKEFHPDRLANISPSLAAHPMTEKIFQMINHAYEVLSDPQRRSAYDRGIDLRMQEDQIRRALERKRIEELMRRGETAVREGNHEAARETFRQVLAADAGHPAARACLTFTEYVLDGAASRSIASYEERFREIAQAAPDQDTVELMWGLFHKRAGNLAQALAHFQKATQINSNCVDAMREIRLINMRQADKSAAKAAAAKSPLDLLGIFGKKKK